MAPRPRTGDLRALRKSIRIDPKRKARFEAALREMQQQERREAGGYDAYWEAVGEILDAELWTTGGYQTDREFVEKVTKTPWRTALRHVRVARLASPAQEVLYTTSKLDAAIAYVDAKSGGAPSGRVPIDFAKLRVPVRRDGTETKVLLEHASVVEVRSATRTLLGKLEGASRRSPAAQAIAQALGGVASLKDVTVRVTGGLLGIGHVPLAAFEHFVRALAKVDLPRPATQRARAKTGPRRRG